MAMTRVQRLIKMATDIGNCKSTEERKKEFMNGVLMDMADDPEYNWTEEEKAELKREASKYL